MRLVRIFGLLSLRKDKSFKKQECKQVVYIVNFGSEGDHPQSMKKVDGLKAFN